MKKKTLVLGASEKTDRYSNMAVRLLAAHEHPVVAVGNKAGAINSIPITTELAPLQDVDTVTLYLNPTNQQPYYEYILGLQPKRIIFNLGTENDTLQAMAAAKGIITQEACTLVLLNTGQY
ncbi:MAG TPA: CoA-binding protein [Chitinophagaceae bacterium]|nr:CoA-binding protein [Chitinophagaceae bacterium]HAN39896.1 CoA-binding protein [Chitinophagaceae bacterium]